MTKKQLQQYRLLKKELEQLKEQLIEAQQQYLPYIELDSIPMGNQISNWPLGYCIRVEKIRIKIDETNNQLLKIEYAIEKLEPIERIIIRERYINGTPWETIARMLNHSLRHIHRLHARILEKMAHHVTFFYDIM